MRTSGLAAVLLISSVLAGCGGGGGGDSGGGVITPAPPPTNASITNLTVSQTFSGAAARALNVFDLQSGQTVSGSGSAGTMSIAYNAGNRSYTVSIDGQSQSFSPGDVTSNANGETIYARSTGSRRDRLTLVTTPYSGGASNQYVGLGFWQRADVSGQRQDDQLTTFVYGIETPSAAAPRTGSAHFAIDVFGIATTPGFEPSTLQGGGSFNVDFGSGVFSTRAYLRERGLFSGSDIVGGGIDLVSSGLLSGQDATFSGNVTVGTFNARTVGALTGRFYGPGAEELGASFTASNAQGATVVGSLTGQRRDGPAANLTLTNIITDQRFFSYGMSLNSIRGDGEVGTAVRFARLVGSFQARTDGSFSVSAGTSATPVATFTSADVILGGPPNFTSYRTVAEGRDIALQLYNVGSRNSELALTYVSLGRWQSSSRVGVTTDQLRQHFVYGIETPERLMAARTGSARYEGVAYGSAFSAATAAEYDVQGTSGFDVDFSRQTYTGQLTLRGTTGSTTVDFGRYEFGGALGTRVSLATIMRGDREIGDVSSRFYGPTGEEIGADFYIRVPEAIQPGGIIIGGAAVARRQ